MNTTVIAFVGLVLLTSQVQAQEDKPSFPEVALSANDRILVLAPHPDDEVLGCAGIIQKAKRLNIPVRVVFFTYGDFNQWSFMVLRKHPVIMPKAVKKMGIYRHNEALNATRKLGLNPEQLTFLGYPDFGTLSIWYAHWGKSPPYKSLLSRASSVPYKSALRPGAPYKGEDILQDLTSTIREFKPTKIFVSHAADHNPDHRSLYLFLKVVLWDLEKEYSPEVYPYLVHFRKWPPSKIHSNEYLFPPKALMNQINWQINFLSDEEVKIKEQALSAHRSQYQSSRGYLDLFIRSNELFGDFPTIKIKPGQLQIPLASEGEKPSTQGPEELTDYEQASFVGVEWRYAWLEGEDLVLSIELSRPLAKGVDFTVDIYGYRSDRPFIQMPKLHVKVGVLSHAVYDQKQRLSKKSIKVARQAREIILRVPLKTMGRPDRILTSARTYLGRVPLDWVSWRVLELPTLEP